MRFTKRIPKRTGYYWVKKKRVYAPRLAMLGKEDNSSRVWIHFFHQTLDDPNYVTEGMMFSKRIEEP